MKESQFTKGFYNVRTLAVYKTLKAAKEANRQSHIYRCWIVNNMILKKYLVYAYGESVCTIWYADEQIKKELNINK